MMRARVAAIAQQAMADAPFDGRLCDCCRLTRSAECDEKHQ